LGNPAEKFDSQRLESIFEELVEKLDFSQLSPLTAVFRKSALLKTLTRFLELDAANLSRFREATGNRLIPILLEQPFEISFDADIRLKGFVDRVDLEVDVHHRFTGRYILYDYKKKSLKELKDIVMGDDFQLPLYRTALQPMLMERFELKKPECLALLYFSIEKLEWKGIIRSDMKSVLFESRKRPQVLSEENMDVLLEWVEDEAGGVVSRIRDGDFRLPLTCPANVRQYDCQYSAICRHDEVRMARKSSMMAKLDEVRMARKSSMMAKLDEVRMARKSSMMAKLEGQ
jgi:ATP-dependent helicase/DNAse subunit B